jgi:demethylmenaquinone methyltransferase/2-methoxy-6-polyprenyl-1,4-benzoquinol methylase
MTQYKKEDPSTIAAMFDKIAKEYDKTNAIMSMRLHKLWNRKLVDNTCAHRPKVLIDLCAGTGEITYEYLRRLDYPHVAHLVDFSAEMLACAKHKGKELPHDIYYHQADVQKLPLDSSIGDAATIAYGIRNVKDPLRCIQEVHRILKPNGTFGILELTRPSNPILAFGHRLYLQKVVPTLGKVFASDKGAYEYLCDSIKGFAEPSKISKMLSQTGFKNIQITPLWGGIATLITSQK